MGRLPVARICASGLRTALIIKQEGKCHFCDKEFRKVGPLRLVRLEQELPWWPPNVVGGCLECTKEAADAKV